MGKKKSKAQVPPLAPAPRKAGKKNVKKAPKPSTTTDDGFSGVQNYCNLRSSGMVPMGYQFPVPGFRRRSAAPKEKGGMMRMIGSEMVATLTSSNAAVAITTYVLNARNATTFPKLSAEADVWVKHKFHRLVFIAFGGSASTQAGTPAHGSLVFDILGGIAAPTTLAEIKNMQDAAPWHAWGLSVAEVPVEEGGLKWYTCDGGAAASADAYGAHYVGLPQTTANGDINVDIYAMYDVEFTGTSSGSLVSAVAAQKKEIQLLREELEFFKGRK